MPSGTPYFEETQWLRDTRWIWYAVTASALASTAPLFYVMLSQWIQGASVGERPMTNFQISLTLCGMLALSIVSVIFIRMIRINVIVAREGIRYNFFPVSRGWKLIGKDQIADYGLLEKINFFERIKRGYSRNRLTKTLTMRLQGRQIVRLQLDNRWKINIGTQRPDDFLKALKRMKDPDLTLI